VAVAVASAWSAYAKGSDLEHFAEFCETFIRQSVEEWDDAPLELEAWQERMMGEALAYDGEGMPAWRRVVLCIPRKNGKTTLLAAFALYKLLNSPGHPEVLLAASTDKQAQRLFDAALGFIKRDETLRELLQPRDYKGRIDRADGRGVVYRVSAESGDLDGFNASLVVCDELHAWETPTQRRAFSKLVSGGGARKKNRQLFTITTAGESQSRESSLLGRMIDGALKKGVVESEPGLEVARLVSASTLVYNYTAPTRDPSDVDAIKLANPASWITTEFLEEAAASDDLTTADKLRYHGGVWADAEDVWFSDERWSSLPRGVILDGADVGVGIDGSRIHDTTVVAWAELRGDGRVAVKTHVFSARAGAPHHELCPGGRINYGQVEEFVVSEVFGRFNVTSAAYDPRYLLRSAELIEERLPEAMIAAVEPQSKYMRDALAAMHRLVSDGLLETDGDPILSEHVAATRAEQDERGWVVRKRKHSKPIDAVIAAALAVWRCLEDGASGDSGLESW